MFLWRKSAATCWVEAREDLIQAYAHGRLVIIRRPGRKRLQLEIACSSRNEARPLLKKFGGRIEALPRNWLERFARGDSKPTKIGKRLMVVRSLNELQSSGVHSLQGSPHRARPGARTAHRATGDIKTAASLVIPAAAAFG